MRRIICFVLSILFLFVYSVNGYAYVIDGKVNRTEWENSTAIVLLNGEESNNNIDFATVNWAIEDGSLFLVFNYIENNVSDDLSMIGVSVAVEDSDDFVVTSESSPAEYDSIDYHFEGAMSFDYSKGVTCEIRVGAKLGLPSEISVKARFIDSEGSYSNVYNFLISNKSYVYSPYEPDDYIETTENTTVKNTQTTVKVTEKSTKPEKTTKKMSDKTTKKNKLDLLDLLINDKDENSTEISTVKSERTTKKTAKKTKKSNNNQENIDENQTDLSESVVTVYVTQINTNETAYAPNQNNNISTTEGSKYKLLTGIFGGITLVTVAVLGTIGANRKANKNKKD